MYYVKVGEVKFKLHVISKCKLSVRISGLSGVPRKIRTWIGARGSRIFMQGGGGMFFSNLFIQINTDNASLSI